MKRTILASVLLSAALLGFVGCASNPPQNNDSASQPPPQKQPDKPKDNRPVDQRLTIGMSMDDVIAACGNPRGKYANSDGTTAWTYNDAEKAFIPFLLVVRRPD